MKPDYENRIPRRLYGDLDAFAKKLRGMGCQNVRIVDTAHGKFIMRRKALSMFLCRSTLLTGRKTLQEERT